jgi:replication factor C subunit 2/4
MSNFFDLKARKAAAANGPTSSSTEKQKSETTRVQPWVEK